MVKGDDSYSRGRGFKSRRHILDGHYLFHSDLFGKNFCLKRPKINEKDAGVGPFLKDASQLVHYFFAFHGKSHVSKTLSQQQNRTRLVKITCQQHQSSAVSTH